MVRWLGPDVFQSYFTSIFLHQLLQEDIVPLSAFLLTVLVTEPQPQATHQSFLRPASPLLHLPYCHVWYHVVFWVKDSILCLSEREEQAGSGPAGKDTV